MLHVLYVKFRTQHEEIHKLLARHKHGPLSKSTTHLPFTVGHSFYNDTLMVTVCLGGLTMDRGQRVNGPLLNLLISATAQSLFLSVHSPICKDTVKEVPKISDGK